MNESRRRSILEAASKDPNLIAELPAAVAAAFGVLALRRLGDVLTVACFPRINKQAIRVLRDVLELEIVATPFEEAPLYEAIRVAYFSGDDSVNFPTFTDPAFLEDSSSALVLRSEKLEAPEPALCELPADRVVLASLTYRSLLTNLDAPSRGQALPDPRRTRMDLGELEGGWRIEEDGLAHVYGGADGEGKTQPLLLTQYRFSDSRHLYAGAVVCEHRVQTRWVETLPVVVHPTEVQLTGVESDGTLRFHAYDRIVRVPPGNPKPFELHYYFLSYGNRMHRFIEVNVHDVICVERAAIRCHTNSGAWKAADLGRWFGLSEGDRA